MDKRIFLPRNIYATWCKMPHRAKVAGFFEMKKANLPWNVEQYNEKSQARLCKFRMNKGHREFREDPRNANIVVLPASQLWPEWLEDPEQDQEERRGGLPRSTDACHAATDGRLAGANQS